MGGTPCSRNRGKALTALQQGNLVQQSLQQKKKRGTFAQLQQGKGNPVAAHSQEVHPVESTGPSKLLTGMITSPGEAREQTVPAPLARPALAQAQTAGNSSSWTRSPP